MRVLIYVRPTANEDRGGDWLQLLAQLDALRACGIEPEISTDAHADLQLYDLVLIWNAIAAASALQYFLNAYRQRKRVVLVPFHWSPARAWNAQGEWQPIPDTVTAQELEELRRAIHLQRIGTVVRHSDTVLPLSDLEAEQLFEQFQCPRESMSRIHAGVATSYAGGDAARFREQFGLGDFVLCVGFIAPRKNQLTLIRALRDDPRPLVLLGDVETPAYDRVCREEAETRTRAPVHFLPRQEPAVVADALAAAQVHVLISLYDIGPLVTLEAARAGCPQVVTTECGMRDYFGDGVTYADPEDLEGIRHAIETACAQPRSQALAERLTREFTWERAGEELASALQRTLAQPYQVPDLSQDLADLTDMLERQNNIAWRMLASRARANSVAIMESVPAPTQAGAKNADQEIARIDDSIAALEAWAHELAAANRAQQETLDRIFKFPPVRASIALKNALRRRGQNPTP
jgi:glycosyltransferase involved in cell wall biosynthesis